MQQKAAVQIEISGKMLKKMGRRKLPKVRLINGAPMNLLQAVRMMVTLHVGLLKRHQRRDLRSHDLKRSNSNSGQFL